MKTLYITRHAKASWDFPDLPDAKRPITEKGIVNTKLVIAELIKHKVTVDHIISSHAKRALQTAQLFAKGINFPVEKIEVSKFIYQVDIDIIFNIIFGVKDTVDSLMIVGHNPTFTQFANLFLKEQIEILPTSGVISLSFETDNWNEFILAKNKTNFVLFPNMFTK
jgi:phosphohistidine phosphatase